MSSFFIENKYEVVKDAISKDLSKFIYTEMKMNEKLKCTLEKCEINSYKFGDPQCKNSYSSTNDIFSESLMLYLKKRIEKIVGKKLLPTYTYSRIYYKGSILKRHTDRESCEYTATICIKTSQKRWNIYLEDMQRNTKCVDLNETDMLVFQGRELPHWRKKYKGEEQVQIFLHYVDKKGDYSEYLYDKRPCLGYKEQQIQYKNKNRSLVNYIYLLFFLIILILIIIFIY